MNLINKKTGNITHVIEFVKENNLIKLNNSINIVTIDNSFYDKYSIEFENGDNIDDVNDILYCISCAYSDTGPVKNDRKDNKLMWELLPLDVIEEVVRVYTFGARKYSPNKWQNLEDGYNRYKAALLRHLTLIDQGQHFDPESGLLHAAQVAWNAIALCYFEMKKHGKGDIDNKRE